MVPCSSKVEKFEQIIQHKQANHKPTDSICIIKIFGHKSVLLFQDMFPILPKYISGPYIKGGQLVRITDPKLIQVLEKTAQKILNLLHHNVLFTPTQPDISRIENILLTDFHSDESL